MKFQHICVLIEKKGGGRDRRNKKQTEVCVAYEEPTTKIFLWRTTHAREHTIFFALFAQLFRKNLIEYRVSHSALHAKPNFWYANVCSLVSSIIFF